VSKEPLNRLAESIWCLTDKQGHNLVAQSSQAGKFPTLADVLGVSSPLTPRPPRV